MICKKCGNVLEENAKFCGACGATFEAEPVIPAAPVYNRPKQVTEEGLPEQYRPLGAWSYFGLQLLFSIPIIGFIFLIIFSCKKSNINRRNFARSYWCGLIIVAAIFAILLIISLITGAGIFAMRSGVGY